MAKNDHASIILDGRKFQALLLTQRATVDQEVHQGITPTGENVFYLSSAGFSDEKPATSDPYAGTAKDTDGYTTVKRTSVRELLHSAGLQSHPKQGEAGMRGNFQHQGTDADAGTIVTKE